jgi:O-antigen ligase
MERGARGAAVSFPAVNVQRSAAFCAAGFLAASMFSHTVALRYLLLVAAAGLLVVTAARDRASLRLTPPLWPAYAAWAAWAALSIAWSPEPGRSANEFRTEILYTAFAFWVCFAAAQYRGALRAMLPVVVLGAVAVCGISLHAYALGWAQYQTGWHGGTGNHSSLLLTLMPCVLAAAWYGLRNGWGRIGTSLAAALVALLLAAAFGTQARTIWLGFGAELLLMVCLFYAAQSRERRTSGLRTAIVVLAVIAGALGATAAVHRERTAASSALTLEEDPRLALWSDVLGRIEERPWTGYGFGRGVLRASLREETGDGMLWHAHNLLLDVAVQLGLPGLLLFLALLAAIFREAWRLCRTREDLQIACGAALAAVVVGMLVRNMTDVLWIRQNALVYWGVAGALLGLAAAPKR